jgi:hypothetical protein
MIVECLGAVTRYVAAYHTVEPSWGVTYHCAMPSCRGGLAGWFVDLYSNISRGLLLNVGT